MAKPTAEFAFQPNGLSVKFTDRSSGIPESWSWDFGDESDLDITQNPNHTYSIAGKYTIKFTATNVDGSDTLSYDILVSSTPTIQSTIKEMVQYDLPGVTAVDSEGFDNAVQTWQLYFQGAAEIADADVFDETKWPSLWNVLIAKLVDYDLVLRGINLLASSAATSSTGGTSSVTGQGALKSLEAGPSKASWYDPSIFWSNMFKASVGGSKSVVGSIQAQACAWSDRIGVQLDFCPQRKNFTKKVFLNANINFSPPLYPPYCGYWWVVSKG